MSAKPLHEMREIIRDHYLAAERSLVPRLVETAGLAPETRKRAQTQAAEFVRQARAHAERSGLIDKFLQEYGLSTAEGVTLMRLAEALLRTPDATTANALIEDKIEAGDWAAHKGKSPFPLVNFSTRALILTAAWLDEVEAKDPLGRMAASTKAALDRLGEPVIRASVGQAMQIMGQHFVLGETIDAAMARGKKYAAKGYLFSYDMLGEAAHTDADALKYFDDYAGAIGAIGAHAANERAADNPGISVKLSALHPRYEYGKKDRALTELFGRARALAVKAKDANMGFNIDAEEADRLDLSLDIIEKLMRDPALEGWDGFGVVVQAYQRRAPFVIDWLAALARETGRRIMARLVKGAYWDAEIKRAQVMGLTSYPVYTRKVLTDLCYVACARKLFANTDVFYPQIATHNALTATAAMEMADGYADYEFQRLHGMGEPLHDSLIEHGARSRIYAPVGGHKELLPYLVRRLLENGANSSFVNQLIDPDLSVDDVVADPLDEIAMLDRYSNPHIPAPRDYFSGERLVAKGWDETYPPMAETMSPAVREQLDSVAARPLINGDLRSGVIAPVGNPANRDDAVGSAEQASERDVNDACEAAAAFAHQWASTPVADRAAILRRAAELLEERGEHFMALAVFEAGKAWPDAVAEVREAVDFLRYYANEAEHVHLSPSGRGRNLRQQVSGEGEETSALSHNVLPPHPSPLPNGERESRGADLQPLGVVACISPWNFPLAIFLGQVSASLVAGNCVIAKPAEQTPLIAFQAVKLLHDAGVPAGALHYLPGDGPSVGAPLAAHPAVDGVVFTGSVEAAHKIARSLVDSGKPDATLIAETGGINAMIIDSTALLEQAVTDVIDSAFQSAGQRCSACRVVCVQEDIADRFSEMLAGAMAELAVGDPAKLSTDVGPVIDEEARDNIQRNIERLEQEARLIARAPEVEAGLNGAFIRPVAFEIGSLTELKQEIFGPVLHVMRFGADGLDALVDEINALGYGLTLGVHTRIDETMERVARRARIGNVYVNRNQIGAVVGVQPFGGEALSGTGPKAGGPHYVPALQKRPSPEGDGDIAISDNAEGADVEALIARAHQAFESWSRHPDRGAVLARAVDEAPEAAERVFNDALDLYRSQFAETITLPGPTGESNTLRLRGRGIVLCLGGGGDESCERQIALALAAGNAVVCPAHDESRLTLALGAAGAPADLLTPFENGVPRRMLLDDRVRAVIFDGGAEGRRRLMDILTRRTGPIIPLLSSRDAPWRFAAERALTINTTAAGGDVRLLSLSD